MGQGLPATNLVVDVLAGWCTARGQDVIVVAVVNDEDTPGPHHAGNVPQGQLVVTLVPWRGNYGVSKALAQPICPRLTHTHTHTYMHTQIPVPIIYPQISAWRTHSPTPGMSSGTFSASLEQSMPLENAPPSGTSLSVPPAFPEL